MTVRNLDNSRALQAWGCDVEIGNCGAAVRVRYEIFSRVIVAGYVQYADLSVASDEVEF